MSDYGTQARNASGLNIVLGVWLIFSPWTFDYSGTAAVLNSVFAGILIAVLAACRLASLRNTAGLSGVNLLLGLWTIASPWLLGYTANGGAVRNNVILGVVVATLAIWSGVATIAERKHPRGAPAH